MSVFPEAFHGQDFLSNALKRQDEAGKNRLAVQKNGTGAAFSELAAVLRTSVTEVFTQDLQQSLVRRKRDVCLFAGQHESYLRGLLRFDGKCGHAQSPRERIIGWRALAPREAGTLPVLFACLVAGSR